MSLRERPIEILLVEDNPGDVRLTMEALSSGKVRNNLRVASDGITALEMLKREGEHANAPIPDLVLLDLNLPRMDGRELLAKMKEDEALRVIPVVILTTSRADEDIARSYRLHANCYITKPVGFKEFMEVVRSIEGFWLEIVSYPPRD